MSTPVDADPQARESAPDADEAIDLFGLRVSQTERLKFSGILIAGWAHDGAQAQLGFEQQGRVAQATLNVSGRLTDRVRYFASFNPMNETRSKPACGEEHFFFPNDPAFYAAGPVVPCDPEDGSKRVDTYNTYGLDYIVQQGPLREGYVDWQATSALTARFGRFILPVGFAPLEVGSWANKDLTRIQRLNAEANFGLMLAYSFRRAPSAGETVGEPLVDVALMAVLGDGNREKDYDWFYFANPTLDSNSALTAVGVVRARPHRTVDLRVAYKKGYPGSKVERRPHPWVSVFGEYARYVWGPTATSAEMLGFDQDPIDKPGYYVGATVEYPLTDRPAWA